MDELVIELNVERKEHLYEQIYQFIINEIKKGKLLQGERLPSTRLLAQNLAVSRSTIELAYDQLVAEGYIESRPYKGYYICDISKLFHSEYKNVLIEENISEKQKMKYAYDFSPNGVEVDGFPLSVWRRIQKNALLDHEDILFQMGLAKGELELRKSICKYLHASRGVNCQPEQIIVGAGNDYLLLLLEKILHDKQIVAMENPTYKKACDIFKSCNYEVIPVESDENGIINNALEKTSATMAYVMPTHQFPLGTIMSISRRHELLSWAYEKAERYIIEDDYDSEFRYKGKPIKSLQSLDNNGKVIYMGTFSKAIAPAIRVSYMVLPTKVLDLYSKHAAFYSSTVSRIDQITLNGFLTGGYFERHLNRMRKIYRLKQETLIHELKRYSDELEYFGEETGLHILVGVKSKYQVEELQQELLKQGIKIYLLKDYFIDESNRNSFVSTKYNELFMLGYASVTEEQIVKGLELIYNTIKKGG